MLLAVMFCSWPVSAVLGCVWLLLVAPGSWRNLVAQFAASDQVYLQVGTDKYGDIYVYMDMHDSIKYVLGYAVDSWGARANSRLTTLYS